jgi:hypothetical protein
VRAAVAEVLAADPRRSPREVLGDALHIADVVLRDRIAELRDMSEITAEAAADLTDAATRAAALARAAMDAGVDVEAEVPGEVGDLVVAALSRVAAPLACTRDGTCTAPLQQCVISPRVGRGPGDLPIPVATADGVERMAASEN